MGNVYLWSTTEIIKICEDFDHNIIKISNIDNHLFLLTSSNQLYHGCVENIDNILQLNLLKYTERYIKDLECSSEYVYIVDLEGRVFRLTEDLKTCVEISLTIEPKCCSHGHCDAGTKLRVRNIAVGNFGVLFITTCGQLWGSGYMPQIGITSKEPKKVSFFNGRIIIGISVGYDHAAALVYKQQKTDDTDSDEGEEDVFVSTCPRCISITQISTPSSQTSLNELCPLGISMEKSSTSLGSSSKDTETSDSEQTRKFIHYDGESSTDNEKTEKNIIFRNTEAARDFLTRQFSWVSGEGNLVEYTGRPTRIIKENVSNMANLVYEGVKTVGDKVVTLRRHVSGSSDTTDAAENSEIHSESGASSRDDLLLSSSQNTSEKEFIEQGLQDRSNVLYKNGANLLGTELWTWGNNNHGQLGIGDTIRRDKPIMITKLSNIGVQKVHSNLYHTAACTLDGRTFLWGRNQYNQIAVDPSCDVSSPRLFVLNTGDTGDRISDVSCGDNHTVILTTRNRLYYLGKSSESTDKIFQIKIPKIEETDDIELKSFIHKKVKNKLLTTSLYTCYNNNINTENPLLEDIALEQIYLEELITVQILLIKPLLKKNFNSSDLNVYETLCRNYNEICYFTASNISSLIDYCNGHIPVSDIIMIKYSEEHLFMYRNYLKIISNIISISGFLYISQIIELPQQLYKINLQSYSKRDKKNPENIIHCIFTKALYRLSIYCLIIQKLLRTCFCEDHRLFDIKSKWDNFCNEQEKKQVEAESTKKFWETCGKAIEDLRSPERRLIRDSRTHPIFLSNASRFSTHIFTLLSDIFVHINGTTPTIHNLLTVWAEPLPNTDNLQNVIILTMPEDTYQLYTTEAEQKSEWLQCIQNAIKISLNKCNAHQPPGLRTACYTFTKNSTYKDGKYSGRWCNGKMHGNGKLEWTDGRLYTGQFQNNQMHGFGKLENPNIGIYEGSWKDNLQNGRGVMKYTTGDIYDGYFKDGLPHGHGVRKQGHHMSPNASIYIGEWMSGTKNGYGVMDDIISGEKYLGNWMDNKKHGGGLIVTSDGIYYEGVFNQDVLTGHGLMIFEDGTHYEGEFRAAGKFNGKGILTLSSGDKIEGTLSGSWNEGIKISNGNLQLCLDKEAKKTKPKTFEKFCINGYQKWKAIFKLCYQLLGVPDSVKNNVKMPDTQKIWNNVAVIISNLQQGSILRGDKKNKQQIQKEQLDLIPQFCREDVDAKSFKELKQYLTKAFESRHHPLGSLLTDLTEAYTATYGGLIHPLLRTHAVNELHSIIIRIYDIVKLLFPALPACDKIIRLSEDDEKDIVSCAALLHPLLLPKVYSALFTLYTIENKRDDSIYWKRLNEWYKQSDSTLMSFLNVHQKFWSCQNTNSQESYSPIKDQLFIKAIETLQQLKTTFSPFEKLLVIRQTFQNMTTVAKSLLHPEYGWTMDDLLPVFMFVVIRARILQLGSEIQFMDDFMEPHLENGEFGIMFTTLKACYHQILEEKSTIN